MKLSASVVLLAIASSASAFVISPSRAASAVVLSANAKPAKDHDDDLRLTREVIAKFMGDELEPASTATAEKAEKKEVVAAKDE